MISLIDLDPLPYTYGGISYEDGKSLPDSQLKKMVDDKIKEIVERSGGTSWVGYLSDSPSNFRNLVATILPYKGNRIGNEKPAKFHMLREYLLEEYPDNVELIFGMEADDALAIDQYKAPSETTIICTIDKDLEMVPGWHYKWARGTVEETAPFLVTEVEGLRFFYKQLLTGDMTDNIKGLHGVGKKSTLLSKLDDMDEEEDMFKHVHSEYVKRFGSYADQFMLENGKLLWMLQDKDVMWELPTYDVPEVQF